MGWSGGSPIAGAVWDLVEKHIPKNKKKKIARAIIEEFENHDCDTIFDECENLINAAKWRICSNCGERFEFKTKDLTCYDCEEAGYYE